MIVRRLRFWINALIFTFLGLILVLFALANRRDVTISLDPFVDPMTAATNVIGPEFRAPLFIVLFLTLAIGLVLGAVIEWFRNGKQRRAIRTTKNDLANAQNEIRTLEKRIPKPPLAATTDAPSVAIAVVEAQPVKLSAPIPGQLLSAPQQKTV